MTADAYQTERERMLSATMTTDKASALRKPFDADQIGKLPKGGALLDFVGHAAVTDRLLQVDPHWSWEPVAFDPSGAPLVSERGKEACMWIRLTICGVTRLGVGSVSGGVFERDKQLISDAIRNAAMRFGVGLDLWSRQDLDASPPPVHVPTTAELWAQATEAEREEASALNDQLDGLPKDLADKVTARAKRDSGIDTKLVRDLGPAFLPWWRKQLSAALKAADSVAGTEGETP